MIKLVLASAIALPLGLHSLPAGADDGQLTAEIQSRYNALVTAELNEDWDGFRQITTPNYESVDVHGSTISREQEIAQGKASPPVIGESEQITVLSVELEGDRVAVRQRFDSSFTQMTSDHQQVHKLSLVAFSDDIWMKTGENWMLLETRALEQAVYVDGNLRMHDVAAGVDSLLGHQ